LRTLDDHKIIINVRKSEITVMELFEVIDSMAITNASQILDIG